MYIGYIGQINNEHTFKYGKSRKMFKRDHDQYSKFFKQFDVVYIGETDNCELIEKLYENDLKIFHLYRQHNIKNKSMTELFTISTKYSIEYLVDHLKSLIENNKLPAIQDANNKIANLNSKIEFYKQSDEIKKLELQFKLSENYKLELERDIIVKRLDLQIECERIKLIFIEKGYNYNFHLYKNPSFQ
jgi:hypothetical protein